MVTEPWTGTNYEGAPSDGRAWTTNCDGSRRAVVRGGSWLNIPRDLRSAYRVPQLERAVESQLQLRLPACPGSKPLNLDTCPLDP